MKEVSRFHQGAAWGFGWLGSRVRTGYSSPTAFLNLLSSESSFKSACELTTMSRLPEDIRRALCIETNGVTNPLD